MWPDLRLLRNALFIDQEFFALSRAEGGELALEVAKRLARLLVGFPGHGLVSCLEPGTGTAFLTIWEIPDVEFRRVSQLWNDKFVENPTLASLLPLTRKMLYMTFSLAHPPLPSPFIFSLSPPSTALSPRQIAFYHFHLTTFNGTDMADSPETAQHFIFMYGPMTSAIIKLF